ncbi:hypothetical protein ABIE67_009103 [Streptomyces sp. V4I8]|uniref:hypothetical protein n=1 Tax=Streptomyces sp. V4I8 TaxID=3156469 RepID=UPI0035161B6F
MRLTLAAIGAGATVPEGIVSLARGLSTPTVDSVYSGEKYDARRADELGEWRAACYRTTGHGWRPATVVAILLWLRE